MSFLPSIQRKMPATPASDDDVRLLRSIAAGDRAALSALYRAYQPRLSRFLGRHTRRQEIIEEVVNDTFFVVWQKAGEFREASRASTWLMGIAYRCMLKSLRKAGEWAMEDALSERDHPVTVPSATHELQDWLAKGLERLTLEQRSVIELAYCMGHSLEEITEIVDCPLSTVKARMFHARIKLRNLLPMLAGDEGNGQ